MLEQRAVVLEMYFVQTRYTNVKFDSILMLECWELRGADLLLKANDLPASLRMDEYWYMGWMHRV